MIISEIFLKLLMSLMKNRLKLPKMLIENVFFERVIFLEEQ